MDDVTVLDMKGRVRLGGGTISLHKAIRCLADEGKLQILLNLASVTHIDSVAWASLFPATLPSEQKAARSNCYT
jgi:anti-sigma B factor antagonist